MIRILVVLFFVFGGVEAFGEGKKEKTEAKKEKENEKWYGILAGLSQFYLKDELGSYLRYGDQTRSIALLSLTQGDRSLSSSFITFGRGKLYASEANVNVVYLQSEEYFYGRYLASYLQNKMKLGIMGGMKSEVYFKEYVHPPIHSQLIFDMDFGLGFAIVGDYLLKPRHVRLVTPFARFTSGRSGEPVTFDPRTAGGDTTFTITLGNRDRDESFDLDSVRNYVGNIRSQGSILYGIIQEHIGYILIPDFSDESIKNWERDIDAALEQLHTTSGVIIDLRLNGGGLGHISRATMARFIDTPHIYGYAQFRNRPKGSDFTPLFELQIEPAGVRQYTRPTALLVGNNTASAAEHFVLALRELSHVTVVGSLTAGALGSTKQGQLPNGWTYQLTISKVVSVDMISYEGTGIPPDIAVDPSDSTDVGDMVLEKGIEVLTEK